MPPQDDSAPPDAGRSLPPCLFLLMGPPAVGKLTIAWELESRTGAIVVDNHLINNAVFVPIGLNRGDDVTLADTDALRARVLDVVLEATEAAPARLSHVFTIWLPEGPENAAHVDRLRSLAARRRARFVPVWLNASRGTLATRVGAPERAERSKLTDPVVLEELLDLPLLRPPADAVRLDTTECSPSDAVTRILAAID